MFELRALHAELNQLGLHAVELRFGLGDVQVGGNATVKPVAGQREVFLIRGFGAVQKVVSVSSPCMLK